jgi:hypothetical protein
MRVGFRHIIRFIHELSNQKLHKSPKLSHPQPWLRLQGLIDLPIRSDEKPHIAADALQRYAVIRGPTPINKTEATNVSHTSENDEAAEHNKEFRRSRV